MTTHGAHRLIRGFERCEGFVQCRTHTAQHRPLTPNAGTCKPHAESGNSYLFTCARGEAWSWACQSHQTRKRLTAHSCQTRWSPARRDRAQTYTTDAPERRHGNEHAYSVQVTFVRVRVQSVHYLHGMQGDRHGRITGQSAWPTHPPISQYPHTRTLNRREVRAAQVKTHHVNVLVQHGPVQRRVARVVTKNRRSCFQEDPNTFGVAVGACLRPREGLRVHAREHE
jgi:hypothetical protein